MKKILYILVAAAALIMSASCQKDSSRVGDGLVGDWHYTAEENGVKEDIWISFAEDGTFEMFQKLGEGVYWHSTGEFEYDSDSKTLTGVYSDRYPWKYSYTVSVSGKTLKMTAVEQEGYAVTYNRETIPATVREKALPLTKAESVERHL